MKEGVPVPWMWASVILMGAAMIFLLLPVYRRSEKILAVSCIMVFSGTWINKGIGLISRGFIPSPLHKINEYVPTLPELVISLGVYGIGVLCLTVLLRIATGVKEEVGR